MQRVDENSTVWQFDGKPFHSILIFS